MIFGHCSDAHGDTGEIGWVTFLTRCIGSTIPSQQCSLKVLFTVALFTIHTKVSFFFLAQFLSMKIR